MYIVLVRHGETDFNKEGKTQGSEVDPPLNDMGQKQAKLTGLFLKKYFKFDKIYSSPLIRTKETAKIIGKILGINKITTDDLLIEASKGIFSGKTKEERKEIVKNNKKLKKAFAKLKKMDNIEEQLNFNEIDSEIARFSGEENLANAGKRGVKFIKKLKLEKNILVITHGSLISGTLRTLFKTRHLPRETIKFSKNCHVSIIKYDKKDYELILAGYNQHLLSLYNKYPTINPD